MRRFIFLVAILLAGSVRSASFDCGLTPPDRSQQNQLVWQYTSFLSQSEVAQLNAKLVAFARETSNQILVIVVDTLCGLPESDLAFDIGEKWGIGKKGFDNGIIFLIKPNGTPGQRKVFIAPGYGLEAVIPDLMAKRVVDNEVIPNFKAGNYYQGIASATDVLMAMAKGEFNEKSYGQGKQSPPWPFFVLILVVIGAFLFAWRNRVKGYSKTNNVDFWTAMLLLSQMDRKHSGRYRSGGSWGGGGGFSGGGGFGGFGGGGFGGGGAGGSW